MLKKIIIIFICQIVLLKSISANSLDKFQNFTYVDKYAYDFVISTCHLNLNALTALIESTKDDSREYFYLLNPTTYLHNNSSYFFTKNIFKRKGIGKNVDRILSSDGYLAGLRDCFPNSEIKRNLYTQRLLAFDAFGKLASLSIVGGFAVVMAKGMSYVGRKVIVSPVMKVLEKSGMSETHLQKVPGWMAKAGGAAFAGLIIASVRVKVKEIVKEREEQEALEINPNESTDQLNQSIDSLNENLKLLNLIYVAKNTAKTPEERRSADQVLGEQIKNVEYYLNQILSNESLSSEQRKKYESMRTSIINKEKESGITQTN